MKKTIRVQCPDCHTITDLRSSDLLARFGPIMEWRCRVCPGNPVRPYI